MNTTEQTIELLEALAKDVKSVSTSKDKPLTIELLRKWRKQLVDVERGERFEYDKEDIERILYEVFASITYRRSNLMMETDKTVLPFFITMVEYVISKRKREL